LYQIPIYLLRRNDVFSYSPEKYNMMKAEAVDIQENAGFQAIQIPQEFKIDDDKVYIKKMGNALYIIPFHNPWQSLFDSLGQFSSDFMEDRNQPSTQIRESFD